MVSKSQILKRNKGAELVDVDCKIVYWSDKAILVMHDEKKEQEWLPFSQIEISGDLKVGNIVSIAVPRWLAEKRGMV